MGLKQRLINILYIVLGCTLFALSFNLFFDPFRISPGGVTGLAMVISHLTGLPVGVGVLLMNIPLVLIAFLKLGVGIILSSALAIAVLSAMIDLTAGVIPPVDDLLLAALCGGILSGVALGLIFRGGATTGGTAIAGKLLQHSRPHIKMGKIILGLDGFVVGLTAFVFRDFSLAVYAMISLYLTARVMDAILYGFDFATVTYVISDRYQEIGGAIQAGLDRGVTYLEATGGYKGNNKRVILCAIKRNQVTDLRSLVTKIDPDAFLIVTEGHQIFGDGFLRNS
ncbi:MAG: YitT family protein [Oscillospiraceae bacterium]|nr:YitT family protein [Oscillospiraceae bacterium]